MAINTLITIKDSLTEFVNGHSQLKYIGFEADDHRAPIITQFDEFPVLFVAPIDVLVGRAMNTHTLRIYVYERINDDRLDVWENANDTSLILRDIRVWWNDYGNDDINIIEDPTGTFGNDRELDNLVGYFADFRFEIPSHGRCQVPVNIIPTPIPPPICEPSTVTVNDNEFATVGSGATIDVPVVNNGANPVGVIDGGQVVIGNSEVEINGVQVGDIVAEESLNISVELDGAPAGSWNATDQVWEVESLPCPTDLFWELNYNSTDNVIFIPATVGNVGTFTSGSGSNVGAVTVSTDGVTYGALSFPFTPTAGTTYYFKRDTASVNGFFTLTGIYGA